MIFKFDQRAIQSSLIGDLAILEERRPDVQIIDYIEVFCDSPEASLAVAALAGLPVDSDSLTDEIIVIGPDAAENIGRLQQVSKCGYKTIGVDVEQRR